MCKAYSTILQFTCSVFLLKGKGGGVNKFLLRKRGGLLEGEGFLRGVANKGFTLFNFTMGAWTFFFSGHRSQGASFEPPVALNFTLVTELLLC